MPQVQVIEKRGKRKHSGHQLAVDNVNAVWKKETKSGNLEMLSLAEDKKEARQGWEKANWRKEPRGYKTHS